MLILLVFVYVGLCSSIVHLAYPARLSSAGFREFAAAVFVSLLLRGRWIFNGTLAYMHSHACLYTVTTVGSAAGGLVIRVLTLVSSCGGKMK